LLKSAAAAALGWATSAELNALSPTMPTIDAHIHLFDPTRPGGVPWPEASDFVLFRPALPDRYARLAQPHGVVGAIAVECSPWLVDNFWLQDVVERNPLMVGYVGNLLPDSPDFGTTLDRLHRSPFFLGIRYGNLWNRDLGAAVQNSKFVDGLKLLAQSGLVLETANPDAALIAAVMRVSDAVPELRIVLDHMPHADAPSDAAARAAYEGNLRELSQRPSVYVKGSEIVRRVGGKANLDAGFYKASLDRLWELFGDDRIFFGSDWPNSDTTASYDETFQLVRDCLAARSGLAREKYFSRNSCAVYRWRPRTADQVKIGER
jgi:predicted TIM-barrel fold metal-dependent hydrolase